MYLGQSRGDDPNGGLPDDNLVGPNSDALGSES